MPVCISRSTVVTPDVWLKSASALYQNTAVNKNGNDTLNLLCTRKPTFSGIGSEW